MGGIFDSTFHVSGDYCYPVPGNAFFYLIIARQRRQRILLNAAQEYNIAIALDCCMYKEEFLVRDDFGENLAVRNSGGKISLKEECWIVSGEKILG